MRHQSTEIFDRQLKHRQRKLAFNLSDSDYYDYLRIEAASRLTDRLIDITRKFPLVLELGSHRSHILKELLINIDENQSIEENRANNIISGVETLIQCDFGDIQDPNSLSGNIGISNINKYLKTQQLIVDEEFLPFKENSFNLVISSLSLHWVNSLPSTLLQIKSILKPDGVFLGSILGGNTLQELRYCLYLAEEERRGGVCPHTSPFALASDIASLMQGAEFALPTVDVDTVTVFSYFARLMTAFKDLIICFLDWLP